MRRVNKILMATVAILLCLVLISTSVVSGVFARFVVSKSAEIAVGFTKFGVSVKMTVLQDLIDLVGEENYSVEQKGHSASITLSNLTMYPGSTFPEAVKVEFSGEAGTDLRVKIYADADYSRPTYKVTAEELNEILNITTKTKEDYFIPTGLLLTVPAHNATEKGVCVPHNALSPWRNVVQGTANATFAKSVGRYMDLVYSTTQDSNKHYYAYKDFNTTDKKEIVFYPDNATESAANYQDYEVDYTNPFKTFYLGYTWPLTWSGRNYSADQISAIETWLMNQNRDFSYSVTFVVEIEQITN